MITQGDIDNSKFDIVFVATLVIVTQVVKSQTLSDISITDKTFINQTLAVLIAFLLYDIILNRFTVSIISASKIKNKQALAAMNDIIKFSSVFIIKEYGMSMVYPSSQTFSKSWMMRSSGTILGYVLYDLLSPYMMNVGAEYQLFYNDVMKVSFGDLFSGYLINNTLDYTDLINVLGSIIGLGVFHLFSRKIVTDKASGPSSFPGYLEHLLK
jgi:hypothetical protein